MFDLHRVVSVAAISTLSFGSLTLLSACSPEQIVQNAIEKAVEDQTGVQVDVNEDGGGTLPDSWPSEVPVIDGNIIMSGSYGTGADQNWSLEVNVGSAKDGYQTAKDKLTSAGYETIGDFSTDGSYSGVFDNGTYNVTVSSSDDGTDTFVVYLVVASVPQ